MKLLKMLWKSRVHFKMGKMSTLVRGLVRLSILRVMALIMRKLSYWAFVSLWPVLSFRRDHGVESGIFNGIRTAHMLLLKTIPSSVCISGKATSITHAGQPKMCHKCGDEGHLTTGCKNPRCYNCESPEHRAAD